MWSNKHVLAQKIETLCELFCIYLCHEGDICGPTGVWCSIDRCEGSRIKQQLKRAIVHEDALQLSKAPQGLYSNFKSSTYNRSSVHETKLKWSFFHFPTSFLTKAIISKGGFMKFLIGENYHWSSLIILRIIIISYHARIKLPQVQRVTAIFESWLQSPVISLPVINAPPVYRCYQLPCHLCQQHPCVADVSVWIAAWNLQAHYVLENNFM